MKYNMQLLLKITLATVVLFMVACSTTDSDTDTEPDGRLDLNNLQAEAPEGTYQAEPIEPAYVGEVDSDLFVGISIEGDAGESQEVLIYLCDGDYISHWFSGEVDASGSGTFTSEDEFEISIELEAAGGDLSGTVAFGDESQQSFTATPASGDAGLYRAEETFDGEDYIAGWIVLQNGRQLGSKVVCFRHPRTGRRMCVSVK